MSKIERHSQKDRIDQKILSGVPYLEIAESRKRELNFNISHMSIKRYADSAGLSTNRASCVDEIPFNSDNEFIDDDLALEIPSFKDVGEIKTFTRQKIFESYALQTAIVVQKQRRYMEGKGKYPNAEIAGLKTIASVLGFISDNKDLVLKVNDENV